MPNFGTAADNHTTTLALSASARAFRGVSPATSNMTLDALWINCRNANQRTVRLCLFTGGTSDTDMDGATLIGSVQVTSPGDNTLRWIEGTITGSPIIPSSTRLWFVLVTNDGNLITINRGASPTDWIDRGFMGGVAGATPADVPASPVASSSYSSISTTLTDFALYATYSTSAVTGDVIRWVAQPANTDVGDTMADMSVEVWDSNAAARDTGYSGTCEIALGGLPTPASSGTFVQSFSAGLATYDDIIPLALGDDFEFAATAGDFATVDSDTFNVTLPAGGTVIIPDGGFMASPVLRNAVDNTKRRIRIRIYNNDGTDFTGSVTDLKARVVGAGSDLTNDIVRESGNMHYVQLERAESDTTDPTISIFVAAGGDRRLAMDFGIVTPNDWTTAALTSDGVADATILLAANVEESAGVVTLPLSTGDVTRTRVTSADGTRTTALTT